MRAGEDPKSKLHILAVLLSGLTISIEAQGLSSQRLAGSEHLQLRPADISQATFRPIPHPDLNKLDPAVRRQIETAQSALDSGLEKHETGSEQLARLYGELGKLYHAYDFPDAALACYMNARRLAPREFIWPYYAGRLYQNKSDNHSAIQALNVAREIRPDEIVVQLSLAQAYLDENQPEAAEPLFQRALQIDSRSAAAMAGLGKVALSAGKFSDAIRYFEAALALQPHASSIHYNLAMAYRQAGDIPKALDHLQKRGPEKPKIADPYMEELDALRTGKMVFWLRGNEAMHQHRFHDAVEAYGRMVAADEQDPVAKVSLGSALVQTGDLEGALKQYTTALALSPNNDVAHYDLGLVLLQRGSEQQAIHEFSAAVSSNPGSVLARFNLANLLMRSGHYESAYSHYTAILRVEPSHEFARLMQSMALIKLKRYSEAADRLEESLVVMPRSADIAQALARLLAACPDEKVRNGRRALGLVQMLLKNQKSPELEIIETLAMALAEVGRFQDASKVQARIIAELVRINRQDLVSLEKTNLTLYENNQPCRQPWRDDDPIFSPRPGNMEVVIPKDLSSM